MEGGGGERGEEVKGVSALPSVLTLCVSLSLFVPSLFMSKYGNKTNLASFFGDRKFLSDCCFLLSLIKEIFDFGIFFFFFDVLHL